MYNDVVKLITKVYAEVAESEGLETPDDLSAETTLFGDEGVLDSMALVTMIVEIEQTIEDEFDITVSLADEKALSRSRSPYRSIGTLAEYAAEQMGE